MLLWLRVPSISSLCGMATTLDHRQCFTDCEDTFRTERVLLGLRVAPNKASRSQHAPPLNCIFLFQLELYEHKAMSRYGL